MPQNIFKDHIVSYDTISQLFRYVVACDYFFEFTAKARSRLDPKGKNGKNRYTRTNVM